MDKEIKIIGKIDFLDITVKIYYHPDNINKPNIADCCWGSRNPDSFYRGIVYMNNETGKISYPKDAIIPEQTDSDREILPKFIIVGQQELNDDLIKTIKSYLESEYNKRNKI